MDDLTQGTPYSGPSYLGICLLGIARCGILVVKCLISPREQKARHLGMWVVGYTPLRGPTHSSSSLWPTDSLIHDSRGSITTIRRRALT